MLFPDLPALLSQAHGGSVCVVNVGDCILVKVEGQEDPGLFVVLGFEYNRPGKRRTQIWGLWAWREKELEKRYDSIEVRAPGKAGAGTPSACMDDWHDIFSGYVHGNFLVCSKGH